MLLSASKLMWIFLPKPPPPEPFPPKVASNLIDSTATEKLVRHAKINAAQLRMHIKFRFWSTEALLLHSASAETDALQSEEYEVCGNGK